MKTALQLFYRAFIISFLGSLPLGMLNLTAFEIAVTKTVNQAIVFSIAAVLVELVAVRLILFKSTNAIFKSKRLTLLIPATIAVLIYLSLSSFNKAGQPGIESKAGLFANIQSPFLLGLSMSAINPMHIPFWITWNTVLINKKVLERNFYSHLIYLAAIGIASLSALMLFVFFGKYVLSFYYQYSTAIACGMGLLYASLAIILFLKFFKTQIQFTVK